MGSEYPRVKCEAEERIREDKRGGSNREDKKGKVEMRSTHRLLTFHYANRCIHIQICMEVKSHEVHSNDIPEYTVQTVYGIRTTKHNTSQDKEGTWHSAFHVLLMASLTPFTAWSPATDRSSMEASNSID